MGADMMDPEQILDGLNEEQRAAAVAHGGPVLITAGPGSGKTRTVTRRIAYGVRTGAIEPHRAMALTFTSRAAGELRQRLTALGAGEVSARTFHSAALRQLRHFWSEAVGGEPARIVGDRSKVLTQAIQESGVNVTRELLGQELDWIKAQGIDSSDYPATIVATQRKLIDADAEQLASAMAAYEQVKATQGIIDFADVLLLTIGILDSRSDIRESVRRQYRWFTVDEYQDVSPLQQRLLDLWLGDRGQICAVGDPAQSIYAFAGADAGLITSFPQRYPGATIISLPVTYRCAPRIVEVANRLASGITQATELRSNVASSSGSVQVLQYPSDGAEASGVADEISTLVANGDDPREMAILFRTNQQVRGISESLRSRGISYAVRGSDRFFDRAEVREAITRLRGEIRADPHLSSVDAWRAVADAMGFELVPPEGEKARLRWESLAAVAGLVPEINLGRDLTSDLDRRANDQDPPRPAGVSLLTLHAAKGLEWDTVFIIGAWDGMLPFVGAATDLARAEELRLVYVGVTRPRQRLMITWGLQGDNGRRRVSPYLDGAAPERPIVGEQFDLTEPAAALPDSRAGQQLPPARCRVCRAALVTGTERVLGRCSGCPSTADEQLVARLNKWRSLTAAAEGIPSFAVMTSATLQAIAELVPIDVLSLQRIPGMTTDRIERYSQDLLVLTSNAAPASSGD